MPDRAQLMAATATQLSIGRNAALSYGAGPATLRDAPAFGMFPLAAVKPKEVRIRVLGEDDRPLEGAVVTLTGTPCPASVRTRSAGRDHRRGRCGAVRTARPSPRRRRTSRATRSW